MKTAEYTINKYHMIIEGTSIYNSNASTTLIFIIS